MRLQKIKEFGKTPKSKSRHRYGDFLRPLAPYVTKVFVDLNLNPTTASLLSIFLSLIGSSLFLTGDPIIIFYGFIIHHIGYFFDIVDGQVARILNKSNVSGAYLDAVNHFFNIPIIFLFMGIGLWKSSGMETYLFAGIIASFFSRGNSKYCLQHSIFTTIKRIKEKESDKMHIPKMLEGHSKLSDKKLDFIRSLVIFPNIIGILFGITTLKLILNHFGMDFLLIETSLLIYASTYAILDISDIVLQYIKKNPDKQFLELKK